MTSPAAPDPDDVDVLLALYEHDPHDPGPPRMPWTWDALTPDEAAILARLVDTFAGHYNAALATTPEEIVPPCWRQHPALAHELAVLVWLYYTVHHHHKATVINAAEFYSRWLPGFRGRVGRLLGRSPIDCRNGHHVDTWRKDLDETLANHPHQPHHSDTDSRAVEHLNTRHFGFPTTQPDQL